MPCPNEQCSLSYEQLLEDALTRLVMRSDGVTREELAAVLQAAAAARDAATARE